jgi:hypothetical protein
VRGGLPDIAQTVVPTPLSSCNFHQRGCCVRHELWKPSFCAERFHSADEIIPCTDPMICGLKEYHFDDRGLIVLSPDERTRTLGRGMAAEVTVRRVVSGPESSRGSVPDVSGLPHPQSLFSAGSEPGSGFRMVLGKGPGQVLHFNELTIECTGGIAVSAIKKVGGAFDQRSRGLAKKPESDLTIIAIPKRGTPIDAVGSKDISYNTQCLANIAKTSDECTTDLTSCKSCALVPGGVVQGRVTSVGVHEQPRYGK